MSRLSESLAQAVLTLLPPRSRWLYAVFRRYLDRYDGNNNTALEKNGELQVLRATLPGSQLVFDVGANSGEWSRLALQINPALRIHCFEPSRSTFQRLLTNQFPANVVCNHLGLSSRSGSAELLVFEPGSGLNSLYRRDGLAAGWGLTPQQQRETIQLETGDLYSAVHLSANAIIDYCKLDVEGHELEVLKGFEGMLRQGRVRRIQFEYGGCNIDARVFLLDLFNFLQPLGYTFYKLYPDGPRRVAEYDQRLENFQYQNWLTVWEA